jgi:hypothetical protein
MLQAKIAALLACQPDEEGGRFNVDLPRYAPSRDLVCTQQQ